MTYIVVTLVYQLQDIWILLIYYLQKILVFFLVKRTSWIYLFKIIL